MDQVTRIGIFLAVVKAQSFAGAARSLGMTSSAVSKQVQNLEQDLGVKLLNRTTRHVAVTEEGAIYSERAKRALLDLQEAEEELHALKAQPRGPLRVSVPHGLGATYLTGSIAAFARTHPRVALDVSLSDRFIDPMNDGYDVVVRIGTLSDSSLMTRRLASCPFMLCASPDYLARHGTPETPEDLTRHEMLAYSGNQTLHEWRYRDGAGQVGRVTLGGAFRSDAGEMLCRAALDGIGIAILPVFYVADHLKAGHLEQLLPDHRTWPERDIHVLFQPSRYQPARLRLFVDHLVHTAADFPWERG
ncbi:LysR family transcriptional regulator [Thalassorhabdomicrobium marinisediminis]|uniref:LysR family transcriptional regulator n=1 Tax=Thalassorhabdomicrobium marinisediminis TaxID=2170577 RepID=A0A2T7G1D2_9RHOB|nr:LysR family transcriptional regulator [Thalassorhabdomicrobium marinisediminis]PVA08243.1 LysR family transcriptional regulator [Thalassorhabdomicrobium marinisediminis]